MRAHGHDRGCGSAALAGKLSTRGQQPAQAQARASHGDNTDDGDARSLLGAAPSFPRHSGPWSCHYSAPRRCRRPNVHPPGVSRGLRPSPRPRPAPCVTLTGTGPPPPVSQLSHSGHRILEINGSRHPHTGQQQHHQSPPAKGWAELSNVNMYHVTC